AKIGLDISNGPDLKELVAVMADKVDTLVELAEKSSYFYSDDISYDENDVKKHIKASTGEIFVKLLENFEAFDAQQWQDPDVLYNIVSTTAEQCQVGMGKVVMP
ncbi:glutamate--tRNA ligase, partial [Francisella tularensis subsp. holarctica]|nr:glutamate--tRNA ligase [Francisella tularensis subsp. holarctica]